MANLRGIKNDFASYQQLINFYHANKEKTFESIPLSLSGWFSANNSSILGAILYRIEQEGANRIILEAEYAEDILKRNGFLSFFGHPKELDRNDTTIAYQILTPRDGRYFNTYVFKELLGKPAMPKISDSLKKKLSESIYEIFINTQLHSKAEKIFICGQFYPQKHLIKFMITDIGVGIQQSVNRRFGSSLNAMQAIQWAMKTGNTTKQGVSGGIGLAILQEFIEKNNGKIQVISDNGFWELSQGQISSCLFSQTFPGTAINIEVRTDDTASYALVDEVSDDIF